MKKTIILSVFAAMLFSGCAGSNAEKESQAANDSANVVAETVVDEVVTPEGVAVIELTDVAQLDAKEKPVIVDFNAVWCGPCQKFAPHFKTVAQKMSDKASFVSVDVDKWQDVAMKYDAQSIPMIVIIKPNGEIVSQVGYMTEQEFEKFVNDNI